MLNKEERQRILNISIIETLEESQNDYQNNIIE